VDEHYFFQMPVEGLDEVEKIDAADALVVPIVGSIPEIGMGDGRGKDRWVPIILREVPYKFSRAVIDPQGIGARVLSATHVNGKGCVGRGNKHVFTDEKVVLRNQGGRRGEGDRGADRDGRRQGDGGGDGGSKAVCGG